MSYQGDDPNRPRERQRTESQRTQPLFGQTQPIQWQGQPQGPSMQQPPAQNQYTQGSIGGQQGGSPRQQGGQRAGVAPSGQQSGSQPGMQQPAGYQQRGTQAIQPTTSMGVQGSGATGVTGQQSQYTQPASPIQSPPRQGTAGIPGQQRSPRARMSPASLGEVVSTDVVTAKRDTPIATVAAMLKEKSVGCVVVVETDGKTPVGVLTDRKIALAVETEPEIGKRTAEELVSSDLLTGRTDMTVFEALDRLKEAGVRRLPIVDEDGALAGIVTLDDLLILLGTNLQDAAEIIASQTTRRA